jgi:hypothetical protein
MKRALVSLALLLFPFASAAGAAGPAEGDAEALLKEGIKLRQAGKDEAALEKFNQAYQKSPIPKARAQIGLAEQALGRWLEAAQHVREAIAAANDPWIQKNKDALKKALEVAERHLGKLEVIGGAPGATVKIDGREAGTVPGPPIEVVAGQVVVEVSAPGYLPIARTVSVNAGSLSRESINLVAQRRESAASTPSTPPTGPVANANPPTPPIGTPIASESAMSGSGRAPAGEVRAERKAEGGSTTRTLALVGAGVGAIAAGIGIGLYFDVDGKYNTCAKPPYCAVADQPRGEDGAAVAMLWGGAAVAAVGVAFYFIEPLLRSDSAHASVTPFIGPQQAGVLGRF